MIQINHLEKKFGKLAVLKNIQLTIDSGKVTAVVGPNGSGKTTLIKCILGLVKADRGEILVDGHRLNGDWMYREKIGYMPQIARFPENLTVRDILHLIKDLRNHPQNMDEELYHSFNLEKELNKPLRTLSGGTRQKVSAVITFLFNPDILILDEPTAGLDPISSSRLKDKIQQAKQNGQTIILTSHIMSEIQELADQIVFLLEGNIYFEGSLTSIIQDTREAKLERAIAQIMKGAAA